MVKSELSHYSGSVMLKQLNPIHESGHKDCRFLCNSSSLWIFQPIGGLGFRCVLLVLYYKLCCFSLKVFEFDFTCSIWSLQFGVNFSSLIYNIKEQVESFTFLSQRFYKYPLNKIDIFSLEYYFFNVFLIYVHDH